MKKFQVLTAMDRASALDVVPGRVGRAEKGEGEKAGKETKAVELLSSRPFSMIADPEEAR